MTGFGTQLGVTVGEGSYFLAAELITAPAAFITGAWVNGLLTVARTSRGAAPRYDLVTLIMPILIFALLIGGNMGVFGKFGGPLLFSQHFIFLDTLSFVCGMQNACFATLTKGQIRTTHLTGLSTDFGTDLALTLAGELPDEEKTLLKKKNIMRAATFGSFFFGAAISAIVDSSLQYWSLAVPLTTSLFVTGVFFTVKYEIDHKADARSPQPTGRLQTQRQ